VLMGVARLGLATCGFKVRCSTGLSYTPKGRGISQLALKDALRSLVQRRASEHSRSRFAWTEHIKSFLLVPARRLRSQRNAANV
jgi:hypothetical protein